MKEHDVSVGLRLSALRRACGMTQRGAAEALGVCQSNISQLESGKRRVSGETALCLAKLYGVSLEDILGAPDHAEKNYDPPVPGEAEYLLRRLAEGTAFDTLAEVSADYLAVAAYRLFRAVYECNPHNGGGLFSIDRETADRLSEEFLKNEPAKLAAVLGTAPAADRSELELRVEDAARLRSFIDTCEALLVSPGSDE